MPGWGDAFKVKTLRDSLVTVGSATPAIFMSILLFILPQVPSSRDIQPWGVDDLGFFVSFRGLNLLPRRTTSGRSLRWRRVWRTRPPWSLGGWSRRRCAGEWSSFLAEDLHSPRWVLVRAEYSVGRFCINLLEKTISRVVPGTCDLSDTWWDWWEGRTWPTRRQTQRVFFKDICNFLWRFSTKVIDEIISKKSGLKHRKRRHTRVLNKVGPRPPSTLVSQLSWWSS